MQYLPDFIYLSHRNIYNQRTGLSNVCPKINNTSFGNERNCTFLFSKGENKLVRIYYSCYVSTNQCKLLKLYNKKQLTRRMRKNIWFRLKFRTNFNGNAFVQ